MDGGIEVDMDGGMEMQVDVAIKNGVDRLVINSTRVNNTKKVDKMSINELTLGQLKEIMSLASPATTPCPQDIAHHMIGMKVIIRTYSAGVWYGTLSKKAGNEVILTNARRMWKWQAAKSISLSGVVAYGINPKGSKLAPEISEQWLEAIEIMPCTDVAIHSIEGCADVEAD